MAASWQALAQLSPRAYVRRRKRSVTAVFPGWARFNHTILQGPTTAGAVTAAASDLATLYGAAAVPSWALWLPSPLSDLDPPAAVTAVPGMTHGARSVVMTRTLTPDRIWHPAVVPTSVDTASRAADEAVSAPPRTDGIPGLDGWALVHEGAAVAGAWSYLHGGDCGVYGVGTAPAWRRRGLAAGLVRHVMAQAHRRGARTASLQSTRAGEPFFRSLGFVPVGRYETWVPKRSAD